MTSHPRRLNPAQPTEMQELEKIQLISAYPMWQFNVESQAVAFFSMVLATWRIPLALFFDIFWLPMKMPSLYKMPRYRFSSR